MNPQLITATVAVAGAICTAYLWVTRKVIREEIARAMRDEVRPLRQDVEVLRVAVFNHLSHDQQPVETHIREVLGLGPR